MAYREDNHHRTKKKGAKGSSQKQYEPLDGNALLKQLQKEKAEKNATSQTPSTSSKKFQ